MSGQNLNIIKFLVDHGVEIRPSNDLLIYICEFDPNLEVIKYLIKNLNMDPMNCYNSDNNFNCLMFASRSNPNLEVIKYLIKVRNMDPHKKTINGKNCMTFACKKMRI